MRRTLIFGLFLSLSVLVVFGCGGGGGSGSSSGGNGVVTQNTKAIVKLATSGTLPPGSTIDGLQFTLNYATNKGLSIVDAGVAATGTDASATIVTPNATVPPQTLGTVTCAIANGNASPLATTTGEVITLTFSIATATPANIPVLGDFNINVAPTAPTPLLVATTPALQTPLTITVLSVTLQ
jgi:hypothetical protein